MNQIDELMEESARRGNAEITAMLTEYRHSAPSEKEIQDEKFLLSGLNEIDKSGFDMENAMPFPQEDIGYGKFRFRGLCDAIGAMESYLSKEYGKNLDVIHVDENVDEVRVRLWDKTPEIVAKFSTLKATGIIGNYRRRCAYTLFSASGYSVFTDCIEGDYFDVYDEGFSDWPYGFDLLRGTSGEFLDIRIGEMIEYSYWYPFGSEWDDDNYIVEIDGIFYS